MVSVEFEIKDVGGRIIDSGILECEVAHRVEEVTVGEDNRKMFVGVESILFPASLVIKNGESLRLRPSYEYDPVLEWYRPVRSGDGIGVPSGPVADSP